MSPFRHARADPPVLAGKVACRKKWTKKSVKEFRDFAGAGFSEFLLVFSAASCPAKIGDRTRPSARADVYARQGRTCAWTTSRVLSLLYSATRTARSSSRERFLC
eukprot:3513556-Rhodomonas_salina.1